MSASREKQLRQENVGQPDPKTIREAQQRKSEKRSNVLYGAIAAVFVVVALASLVWRSNIIPRSATAAVIDGEKYTAAEVSFYYQNAYRNFYSNNYYYMSYGLLSLNPNADLKTQELSENDAAMLGVEAGGTWHDFFVDQALDQMAAVQNGLKKAQEEGFTYPAGVQAQYQDSMESLKSTAAASGVSVSQYLANIFGSTMTEKVYGEQLNRMLQYDAYTQAYSDSLVYDEATLKETYEADRNSYDKVAYEAVTITGAAASTKDADGNTVEATDEEKEAAKTAAKTAADNMLAAYQAGEKLETLAEGNEKATYVDNDGVSYTGDVLTDWLFNEDRKDGDTAVLESGTTYYVAVFHDRFLEEYPTIQLVLDLHRDASGGARQLRTLAQSQGRDCAQLMVIVGTNYDTWEENLSLALKLHAQLEAQCPGITRPLQLREQRFNEDLSPGGLLIEVGSAGNTRDEALRAAEELANAIAALAKGTRE